MHGQIETYICQRFSTFVAGLFGAKLLEGIDYTTVEISDILCFFPLPKQATMLTAPQPGETLKQA